MKKIIVSKIPLDQKKENQIIDIEKHTNEISAKYEGHIITEIENLRTIDNGILYIVYQVK